MADTTHIVAKAICLATFHDEKIHGDARCCQVGGKDGCCVVDIYPQAEAAIAALAQIGAMARPMTPAECAENGAPNSGLGR